MVVVWMSGQAEAEAITYKGRRRFAAALAVVTAVALWLHNSATHSVGTATYLTVNPQQPRVERDYTYIKSPSTIVAAFFPLKSKHSLERYSQWFTNFLSLQDPMVIFTTPDMVAKFKKLRQSATDKTFFVPMQLKDTRVVKEHDQEFWENQLEIDSEKQIHKSYELFQVWLSKSWFVTEAIKINPFQSDVFVWSDIGCFRNRRYSDKLLTAHPEVVPEGAMLLMASKWLDEKPDMGLWINKEQLTHKAGRPYGWNVYIAGAQMAGRTDAWRRFDKAFHETLAGYATRGIFMGDDQAVTQSVCAQHHRLCHVVHPKSVKGNPWFGLQDVLSKGGERDIFHPPEAAAIAASGSNWCSHVEASRKQLDSSLHVKYPCKGLQPATSAVVTMLTEGLGESQKRAGVFSENDYIRGALALGASLRDNIDSSTHLLFLMAEGITLPAETLVQLKAVGWVIGTAPNLAVQDKYVPRFRRYKSVYVKLATIGLTEYSCVLLMDADTLVTSSLRDLLDCKKMFVKPEHRLVSLQ